jgi:hypothetical protein
MINTYLFDKRECYLLSHYFLSDYVVLLEREEMRKKYVANLESRTAEEIAEEEALYVQYKRIEQNERKFRKERDDLLRLLAGVDSGLPDVVEDENNIPNLAADPSLRKKFKKNGVEADSPSTPATSISAQPLKRPQTAKNAAFGKSHIDRAPMDESNLMNRCSKLYHTNRPPGDRSSYKSSPCASPPTFIQNPCTKGCRITQSHSSSGRDWNISQPSCHAHTRQHLVSRITH